MTLPANGMFHLRSLYSVPETIARVEEMVAARGMSIMARIDFTSDAARLGLKMQPALLLVFGNPKVGSPMMAASPTLALDLPLKALVWEEAQGTVWLSFNSPEYLQERHNVPAELIANIAGVRKILEQATGGSK